MNDPAVKHLGKGKSGTGDKKITIQVGFGEVEKIWATDVQYHTHGVFCHQRHNPDYSLFIPYTSIRMISTPEGLE